MKNRIEKPPIDELFARKLENMTLPPRPDGLARLQARMGQRSETPVVFWHNPTVQRGMALAACVLLVCGLGWQYLRHTAPLNKVAVAVNKPVGLPGRPRIGQLQPDQPNSSRHVDVATSQPSLARQKTGSVDSKSPDVSLNAPNETVNGKSTNDNRQIANADRTMHLNAQPHQPMPVILPIKTGELAKKETLDPLQKMENASAMPEKQITVASNKPMPAAERVLVVTIAEPEALIAARQLTEKAIARTNPAMAAENGPKETKAASLWQQMKRVKQGDIFARKEPDLADERGLISRAYSELKQTFDKDKTIKQ